MSLPMWSEEQVQAGIAALDRVRDRVGSQPLEEVSEYGFDVSLLHYALRLSTHNADKLAVQNKDDVFAAAWLDGVMVGVGIALNGAGIE